MHSGDTVLSAIPIPAILKDDGLTVSLKTNYPFDNALAYDIESDKPICLKVRVPSFAQNLRVNGQLTTYCAELSFEIPAGQPTHIDIAFDTLPHLVERPYDLKCVQCGSLVFSLPISYEKKMLEFERNGVVRKFPYCDYEYSPTSPWNYAYSSPFFQLEKRDVSDIPFSSENPPVVLKAEVKRISWGLEDGFTSVCAKVPQSRIPLSEAETVELYPYGCAKLRMTELPLL